VKLIKRAFCCYHLWLRRTLHRLVINSTI